MCDFGSLYYLQKLSVIHPLVLPGRKEQATEDKCDESRFCKHACWEAAVSPAVLCGGKQGQYTAKTELYSASLLK